MLFNFSNISIRQKITLGPVLLILFLSVFIYYYYPVKQREETIKGIESKIESIIDLMTIGVGIGMGENDLVAISEALNWAKKDSSVSYIIVVNQEGLVVAEYNPENMDINIPTLLRNEIDQKYGRLLNIKREIRYQNLFFGHILLGYSLNSMDESIASLKRTTLYICLFIFISGLLLSIMISTRITNHIRKLNNAVTRITTGNELIKVEVTTGDEIGKLASAFNEMVFKLNRSRDELIRSKQYTENIIMSMLDALFVIGSDNTITSVNPASCNELGFSAEEMLGQQFEFIFASKEEANEVITTLQNTGEIKSRETLFITKSQKNIIVLFSASVITDKKGNQQGVVCVAQDITEIKEAEQKLKDYSQKLERTNQELDQFAYVVSHDLKAPLRAIFKLSEWIQEDMGNELAPEIQKNMELLRGRVFRLESMINGILEYAKIGKVQLEAEKVDVHAMVCEALDLLSPGEKFKINFTSELPVLITQRIRLQQVFMNLLANAIKYNDKETGVIEIGAKDLGSYYEFTIKDNGPGIESQFHDKIFALFQTLEARDKVESTGIGLSIIKKIIDEQDGEIRLESEKGKGAKFIFTWPKKSKRKALYKV